MIISEEQAERLTKAIKEILPDKSLVDSRDERLHALLCGLEIGHGSLQTVGVRTELRTAGRPMSVDFTLTAPGEENIRVHVCLDPKACGTCRSAAASRACRAGTR